MLRIKLQLQIFLSVLSSLTSHLILFHCFIIP
nr:MAG TPA: hypothetical protein [Inoviridae sp.]